MDFFQIKNYFLENRNIDRVIYMTPQIGGVGAWISNAIFCLEKAIMEEPYPELKGEDISILPTILNKLVDNLLQGSPKPNEEEAIKAFCDLASNWMRLYEVCDKNIERTINIVLMMLATSKTFEEQIDLLKLLYRKIYTVFMAEPVETKVSEMYRNKLEDYFSTTKHGEYRV